MLHRSFYSILMLRGLFSSPSSVIRVVLDYVGLPTRITLSRSHALLALLSLRRPHGAPPPIVYAVARATRSIWVRDGRIAQHLSCAIGVRGRARAGKTCALSWTNALDRRLRMCRHCNTRIPTLAVHIAAWMPPAHLCATCVRNPLSRVYMLNRSEVRCRYPRFTYRQAVRDESSVSCRTTIGVMTPLALLPAPSR